jgi:hypothetical protein
MTKVVINCETGETVERELSKAEKDQQKIDEATALQSDAVKATKEAQRLAIADRLGLTADELQILLG